jgi:predicted kinase
MATLHLIYGFVATGKTTFSKRLEAKTGSVRFTLDEWMIALYGSNPSENMFAEYERRTKAVILKFATILLEKKIDVIFDFGLWQRVEREQYRQLAKNLNANVLLYHIRADDLTVLARIEQRNKAQEENTFYIDQNAIALFKERIEPLSEDEDFIEFLS